MAGDVVVEVEDGGGCVGGVLAQQRGMAVDALRALVIQAHQQVVASAGRRDIEQPQPLGGVELVLALRPLVPPGGLESRALRGAPDPDLEAAVGVPEHGRRAVRRDDVQPGEDHDRKLQSLRAVNREHPERVVVGLGYDDLDGAGALVRELLDPLDEAAQPAAGGGVVRARLIEEEPDATPVVARSPVRDRELQHAAFTHDRLDRLAD